ncbi:MAG: hypothetical protein WA951_08355 [Leeuwenhoekiella sp.]
MKKQFTRNTTTIDRVSRISWAAIFAGAVTAISVSFMLNMLGLGIGLSSIDPMTEQNTMEGLGTGTLIWWGLSNLAALFVGGLVAGRMAGFPSKSDGGLHGFLSWTLYTLLSVYILTSTIGGIFSGVTGAISSVFGGSDAKNIAEQIKDAQSKGESQTTASFDKIKKEAFQLINKAEQYGVVSNDASSEVRETMNDVEGDSKKMLDNLNLDENIDEFFNEISFDIDDNGDLNINVEGDKDIINKAKIKDYLTENTELSDEEINGVITKWDKRINTAVDKAEKVYKETKEKVAEYTEKAADTAGTVSIIAFFIFLLGAMAAFFGGTAGSPEHTVEEEELRKDIA